MEEESQLLSCIQETQELLHDIFLSGFHSVAGVSIERLFALEKVFEGYGMDTGKAYIHKLALELNERRNSFENCAEETAQTFCALEFYLKTAEESLK